MTAQLTETEVLEAIREEMARIKVPDADQATMDSTWKDLDVDSLDLVELVQSLEDRYGIEIADEKLKPIATVGDAVQLTLELAGSEAQTA